MVAAGYTFGYAILAWGILLVGYWRGNGNVIECSSVCDDGDLDELRPIGGLYLVVVLRSRDSKWGRV